MHLWNLWLIPMVQVTSVMIPQINDLSSMIGFMRQARSRISQTSSAYITNYNYFASQISHLSCKIHEASSRLNTMRFIANKDTDVSGTLGKALNATINSPIWKIQKNIKRIEALHKEYMNSWKTFDATSIRYLIPQITELSSNCLPALLQDIYRLIAPNAYTDNGFLRFSGQLNVPENEFCGMSMSLATYKVYSDIVYVELLGFIMRIYAYALKSVVGQKSYETEILHLEVETKSRLEEYIIALKKSITKFASTLVNCAYTGEHTRGVTYVDFQGLYQGYLVNQEDANEGQSCSGQCKDIDKGKLFVKSDTNHPWVYDRPCTGKIMRCEHIAGDIEVCEGSADLGRRYDYLKGESDTFGSKTCSDVKKTEPWGIFGRCHYCFCTCVDNEHGSKATRAISYRWSIADYSANKVIIGVRITLKDGLIHLQGYQGKLLPGGFIEEGSQEWIPIDNFEYKDEGQFGQYYIGSQKLTVSDDYEFLTNEDAKILVATPNPTDWNRIVVAVRFSKLLEYTALETSCHTVDLAAGKLDLSLNKIITLADGLSRGEFKLHHPGRPTNFVDKKVVARNKFIRLQGSNRVDDVEQSTVPFFDARPVITNFPIKKVGFAYRGADDGHTGGFITPIIEILNPYDALKTEVPISQPLVTLKT